MRLVVVIRARLSSPGALDLSTSNRAALLLAKLLGFDKIMYVCMYVTVYMYVNKAD